MMEDRGQLEPILASYGIFKPLRTVLPFVLHLSSSLAIEILALVYVFLHPNEQNRCKEYFIVIYAQAALWFLTFVSKALKEVLLVTISILFLRLWINM